MLLTDRVMASDTCNFRQRCNTSSSVEEDVVVVDQPPDLAAVQNRKEGEQFTVIGAADAPLPVQQLVTSADRFKELQNKVENRRLHKALLRVFGK
jgi:hypothetical protein